MQSELARIGQPPSAVEWFAAVRPVEPGPFPSIGARGCFLSHLEILTAASAARLGRILILEDDADFSENFQTRIGAIVERLSVRPWDMFYGGGYMDSPQVSGDELMVVDPISAIKCSHCVAFQGDAMNRVRDYLQAQLGRPPGHSKGGPMHVDGSYSWARRELGLRTLMAIPELCRQRSSRSDIAALQWWDRVAGIRAVFSLARKLRSGLG